jgi:putative N6-adenine-specific DNA methylase
VRDTTSRAAAPETFDAFAIAAPGFASLIASELTALDIVPTAVEDAGVSFSATRRDLARANLWSRVASRFIVRLAAFNAVDFATLERRAKSVPWERVLAPGCVVRLRVTCRKSRLYHSDGVAQRIARGIEGRIARSRVELRARDDETDDDASVTAEPMSQLIIVRFDHDHCTISADSSGALLHRRGWRQAVAKAPLRETIAAAMIKSCGWDGSVPLIDPFAGSGTIGIEAALVARGLAPGLGRAFAMEQWPGTPTGLMTTLKADAHRVAHARVDAPIVIADRDAGACAAARANAERAGVLNDVTIIQRSLSETDLKAIAPGGWVVTNPPYGLRVSEGKDLRALYARLGDVVRGGAPDWRLCMLSANQQMQRETRLRLDSAIRTTNGGLPVSVVRSTA